LAGFLALGLAAGCKAQPASAPTADAAVERRIEIQVRNHFDLEPDIAVTPGIRSPSQFTGYDNLPITLSRGNKTQVVELLISSDNKTLLYMTKMDLTKLPGDTIDIAGRPVRGNPDAKVTIINFDDLECPFCAHMHQELFPATIDHYKGLVKFIYLDNPLTDNHPWAMHASVDANCLAAQSPTVYWNFVDYVHGHNDEVTGPDRDQAKSFATLDRVARQEATLGKLDEGALNICISKQDQTRILASKKEAEVLALEGTPELFINGERVNGAVPEDRLWAVIDRALKSVGEQPPAPLAPAPAPVATKPAVAPAASGSPGSGSTGAPPAAPVAKPS
jgi:protein-disulfide isomerase